jgi:hypothetical protein
MPLSEADVEQAAIGWYEELGYAVLTGCVPVEYPRPDGMLARQRPGASLEGLHQLDQ